jgi:hypothetical protein
MDVVLAPPPAVLGMDGGETGVDDDFAPGARRIGATIMGRNMFGPIRGPWAMRSIRLVG